MAVHFKPYYRLSSFAPDLTLMRHIGLFIPHISLHPGIYSYISLSPLTTFLLLVLLYNPTSLLFLYVRFFRLDFTSPSFSLISSCHFSRLRPSIFWPYFLRLTIFTPLRLSTRKMRKTTLSFLCHISFLDPSTFTNNAFPFSLYPFLHPSPVVPLHSTSFNSIFTRHPSSLSSTFASTSSSFLFAIPPS